MMFGKIERMARMGAPVEPALGRVAPPHNKHGKALRASAKFKAAALRVIKVCHGIKRGARSWRTGKRKNAHGKLIAQRLHERANVDPLKKPGLAIRVAVRKACHLGQAFGLHNKHRACHGRAIIEKHRPGQLDHIQIIPGILQMRLAVGKAKVE